MGLNTHTSTLMDDFKMLFECRRGCWWQFQRHQLILLHTSSLQVPRASLKNPFFKFPVFVVSPSKRRRWLQEPSWCSFSRFCTQVLRDFSSSEHNQFLPQSIWAERAEPRRDAPLLSCGVASLCCFHTAKWCLSGTVSASSRGSYHSHLFFSSDLPPSLLVIQHLLYHTNNSIITVQRQSRRERQAAPNGLLSPMLLCVMGNAALVGCSMYTLSSPVVKTELTLCEADVRIMM